MSKFLCTHKIFKNFGEERGVKLCPTAFSLLNYCFNFWAFDFQIQRMVYGTKRFYIGVRTGNLRKYITDLTKDFGENKKVDAQLNYESKSLNIFAIKRKRYF